MLPVCHRLEYLSTCSRGNGFSGDFPGPWGYGVRFVCPLRLQASLSWQQTHRRSRTYCTHPASRRRNGRELADLHKQLFEIVHRKNDTDTVFTTPLPRQPLPCAPGRRRRTAF
ncbi:hypothetical protein NY78_4176 [Desulfovibrio sp. TomC]|nr:hypothetical protein NY78_4176 [Desulfovibrio sp. TomC]